MRIEIKQGRRKLQDSLRDLKEVILYSCMLILYLNSKTTKKTLLVCYQWLLLQEDVPGVLTVFFIRGLLLLLQLTVLGHLLSLSSISAGIASNQVR